MGVAFTNLRADIPLFPAFSTYRNCKLVANFGYSYFTCPCNFFLCSNFECYYLVASSLIVPLVRAA